MVDRAVFGPADPEGRAGTQPRVPPCPAGGLVVRLARSGESERTVASMPEVRLQTAKDPGRVEFMYKTAKMEIANKIGIRGIRDPSDKDLKKLQELMAKHKKPVDFTIDFDGEWFTFAAKVGKVSGNEASINIAQDGSIKDKALVLKKLLDYKAATPALIEKYKKKNPL